MAVEDVNDPKTVVKVDPRAATGQGEGTVAYWENKAKEARARHDYLAEEEAMKMLGRAAPEPAFQIKGSVNLGDINPQEAARLAQERADKLVEGKDKDIKTANERATEAERKLNEEKIEGLRRDFASQMVTLNQTIEKLVTAKDTRPVAEQFRDQYTVLQEISKSLGLEKTTNGQDPMVAIELKKMEFAEAQKDREFRLKMAQDQRAWEVHLIEIKDNKEFRKAELAQQERRNDMIASFPAIIGGALAKGGRTAAQGGIGQTVQQKAYKAQVGEGETAEFDCPGCGAKVGIGPTTEIAQCVNCQTQFPVERVAAAAAAPEPIPPGEKEEK